MRVSVGIFNKNTSFLPLCVCLSLCIFSQFDDCLPFTLNKTVFQVFV